MLMQYVNGSKWVCGEPLQNVSTESPSSVERWLQRFVFPVQFIVGVVGNTLNVCTLLSAPMRTSKANALLAATAIADVLFFVAMLPNCIANVPPLSHNIEYFRFYAACRSHLFAFANWFSATSIWLIVAVSVERVIGIRTPLRTHSGCGEAREYWRYNIPTVAIAAFCLLLTAYNHVAYVCKPLCKRTRTHLFCNLRSKQRLLQIYVRMSTIANVFLIIAAPLGLLTVLNAALLFYLRRQHIALFAQGGKPDENAGNKTPRQLLPCALRARERKVTVMVVAIVCSFIITRCPSAVLVLWHYANDFGNMSDAFYTLNSLTNCLVVTGKTTNFFLFCTSSATFRQRVRQLLLRSSIVSSTRNPFGTNHDNSGAPKNTNLTPQSAVTGKRYSTTAMPNHGERKAALLHMRQRAVTFDYDDSTPKLSTSKNRRQSHIHVSFRKPAKL